MNDRFALTQLAADDRGRPDNGVLLDVRESRPDRELIDCSAMGVFGEWRGIKEDGERRGFGEGELSH
jgi:hypothetical protein